MIEDVIAKWRGMTEWPEAVAVVTFKDETFSSSDDPPSTRISFEYHDDTQSLQMGRFVVDSLSSLYNLKVDDTFTICFNPRKPKQVYSPEVSTFFTQFRWLFWIGVVLTAIVISIISLL